MILTPDQIRLAQSELLRKGFNPGPVDGVMGAQTRKGIDAFGVLPVSWNDIRKITGVIQFVANELKFDAGKLDGLWGPQTEHAYNTLRHYRLYGNMPLVWRPEEIQETNKNNWPSQKTDADLIAFYGEVGRNQVYVNVPYPHRLAWDVDKVVNRFYCNARVHDSILRVLTKVKNHYGISEIQRLRLDLWGGCLNVRTMRGGTRYSTHSWGMALDYDPENNKLDWGRDKALFARPEYEPWWQFWEEEGWVSLGRQRNFDWMHVQAAKL